MTEEKLARQLREGRRGTLHRAIGHYTPYVSAVAFRAMKGQCSGEDLEEVVADVFVTLWMHAGEMDPTKGLRAWLAAVARNKAADRLRKPPAPLPITADLPDRGPSPEGAVLKREEAALLWQSVQELEEPDRSLFTRYYYEEEPLKDVAKDLGLNLSTAKTRLARGRKRLKTVLWKGGLDHG